MEIHPPRNEFAHALRIAKRRHGFVEFQNEEYVSNKLSRQAAKSITAFFGK